MDEFQLLAILDLHPVNPADPVILSKKWSSAIQRAGYSAVIAPYVSGRRSRKNCHVFRTSRIMSKSMSAITMSSSVRFVLAEPRGTSTLYRINDACVSCFPTAADVVMGKPVPSPPTCEGAPA